DQVLCRGRFTGEPKPDPVEKIKVRQDRVVENRWSRHRGKISPRARWPRRLAHLIFPHPMISPVPAMLPLVLLEAMQNIDTPPDDGLGALEHELAAKRLGLSPTLAAQIRRYREQAEDGDEVGRDDVEAIFRLIGRRPDAELVFADAGRRAARFPAREQGGGSRALAAVSPGRLATSVRMRTASSLAARWLLIELRRTDEGPRAEAGGASLALAAGPSGVG